MTNKYSNDVQAEEAEEKQNNLVTFFIDEETKILSVFLPKHIRDETGRNFIQLLEAYIDDPNILIINIFCSGSGGDADSALMMAEYIAEHKPNITINGILLGGAYSSASVIFAACENRYAGRRSFLGIHSVGGGTYARHANTLAQETKILEFLNNIVCNYYAEASTWPAKKWLGILKEYGESALLLDYKTLIEIGMAQPYENMPR